MKITVEVKASSKTASVEQVSENVYRVRVHAQPVDGKANAAVAKALASHFKVPIASIKLLHGKKSKKKIFQINLR